MSHIESLLLQENRLIEIHHKEWLNQNISLIRFDLMHPEYGGNKWFKLKYNIQRAITQNKNYVVSFGGAYSNHLYSLAAICRDAGLKSVGVIRGEAHYADNDVLRFCRNAGMELLFLSRSEYRNRYTGDFTEFLNNRYQHPLIIPDGGENFEGIRGASDMSLYVPTDCKHLFVACGTFTTLSGMLSSLPEHIQVWAVPALKADTWATETIKKNLAAVGADVATLNRCHILYDFHFGGFAKSNETLEFFRTSLYEQLGIHADMVYGAKLFYALSEMFKSSMFVAGENIAVVMCGRPLTHALSIS